jgi:intracellular septation protein
MKLLFDLFPVILFFAAYYFGKQQPDMLVALAQGIGYQAEATQLPILFATAVAILATFGQIGWLKLRGRKVDLMLWVSLAIILLFGGATLFLHDETFIKWKPTVLYWLFASVLALSPILFGKNPIRAMMKSQIDLPDRAWTLLNLSWALFFTIVGALNLWVAFRFSTDVWVNFKLFGVMGLMLAFVIGQGLFLSKHIEHKGN